MQVEGKESHHTIFNHALSHTWKPSEGEKWRITYGDGSSAAGDVGTDIVNIGGVIVRNQAVELATTMSSEFEQGAGDGLLGLAWVCPFASACLNTTDSGRRTRSTPSRPALWQPQCKT